MPLIFGTPHLRAQVYGKLRHGQEANFGLFPGSPVTHIVGSWFLGPYILFILLRNQESYYMGNWAARV